MRPWVLALAISGALLLGAAPFSYVIEPDHADHVYACGEKAVFTVSVAETNGAPVRAGKVRAALDNFGPKVVAEAEWDLSSTNRFTISGVLGEPGFLRLRLDSKGTPTRHWSVAYEPERIEKGSPSPVDFDEFWREARARFAREVPADPEIVPVPERSTADFDYFRISFASYGRRVHGYMTVPKDKSSAPYPVDFEVNAAGFGDWTNNLQGRKDRICLRFSVYPFPPHWKWRGNNLRAEYDAMNKVYHEREGVGYSCYGISKSREDYFFYPVLLALDRAVDWAVARPDVDRSRVLYHGTSQGGGFGFYLVGLNHNFTRAAFFVPAITDTMGYLKGRMSGWPRIIESQKDANKAAAEKNAPYFDGANFAARIRCPVRVAVGFSDTTCPPCAVYASYNAIPVADKGIVHGFGMGHGCFWQFYREIIDWLETSPYRRAPFDPGERAAFLGDSITHGGGYVFYLQLFQELRAHGTGARAMNVGISGDTAGGGIARWDWDVLSQKPDSVFVMFGMNDVGRGNYKNNTPDARTLKARAASLTRYETNQTVLAEKILSAGKRLRILTPSPYDQYSDCKTSNLVACNEPGLADCAAICRRLASAKKVPLVELHAPLTDIFKSSAKRKFCRDRVHPAEEGHLLMAACVLDSLGVSPVVASVGVDSDGSRLWTENAAVTGVKASDGTLSFNYAPRSLPFPKLPEYVKDDEIYPLTRRFNSETLQVRNLPDGVYALKADGREIGRFRAAEFAAGVNIALLDTPGQRAAQSAAKIMRSLKGAASALRSIPFVARNIKKYVNDLNDVQACLDGADKWIAACEAKKSSHLSYYKGVAKRYKALRPKLAEKTAELEALYGELSAAAKPVQYSISIEKIPGTDDFAYLPLGEAPDSVSVEGDGFTNLLVRSGDSWTGAGVTVRFAARFADGASVDLSAPGKGLSFVRIGWKATFKDVKILCDTWERGYGNLGWGDPSAERALPWYFMASDGRRADGYGVMVQPNSLPCWSADEKGLSLLLDVRAGSRPVRLGARTLRAAELISRKGLPGERPFAAAQAFCRAMCPRPRLAKSPVYGYNDWYCAYGDNTATNFLADAAYISECAKGLKNRPYVVMDDGWQMRSPAHIQRTTGKFDSGRGPWDRSSDRFGMAMPEFASRVAALDAKPGLWYRPFRAWEELPAEMKLGSDDRFVDPTVPAVKAQIAADMRRFRDWGFKLVKIDYLTYDINQRWDNNRELLIRGERVWRDDSRTTAEVLLDLFRTMREGAGDDVVIIGCNALNHFAAGIFELQRSGNDTSGRDWNWTRGNGVNCLAFRAVQDRAFFAVDADCAGLASEGAVSWERNRQWIDLLGRSGTPVFISWHRRLATKDVRAAITAAYQRAAVPRPVGEPLDWFETRQPVRWRLCGSLREYDWK
jgi:alpha-galactosidase